MAARHGGTDRISTKTKFAAEIRVLGELLAGARQRAGLKQSDVAATLGVPASYLSKIENGTRRVDVVELVRIAAAIGADPGDLVRELRHRMKTATGPAG